MIRCAGCGAFLQNEDVLKEGYTSNLNNKFCERCFNIKNYNKYIKMPNRDYYSLVKKSINKKDLVLLVTDFLNLYNLDEIQLDNPVILVITKTDLLPRGVNREKLLNNIKCKLNVIDKIMVSSKNNYNLDVLYDKILKNKKSNNVYVIGYTNAGKSTLVNKILKNYGCSNGDITVSNLPSTTLDLINVKVNDDINLIDTPGFLDNGSMVLEASKDILKKIIPNKEIRPISYQIKHWQSLIFEDFMRLDLDDTNIICYISNNINIRRVYKNKSCELKKYELHIEKNQDLVIKGIGFITFKKDSKVTLWLKENVKYLIRNSVI